MIEIMVMVYQLQPFAYQSSANYIAPNKNMNDDVPSFFKLLDSQEPAAEYVLLYELSFFCQSLAFS
ncbi:MAG: hypothetical protein OXC82_02695 [Rhodobacteraceae bacterium]|nr:hypothetical protein [Paracoccaceae bacterium]MCY4249332.1 hypothetical protein [Paracoccaceae bacterium]